ncbi:pimeloyl-ACP methyl ester carboxylesterase [Panacagrimonas perspica]|uniref:Pimeloyl-ACP methyl ester carboxylesterase n=1 Tax=Panacagrimonas perspica TaxID=381431 RepID=A0A4R7PE53_9GAMM|nr:alpha/beta hydrolase [Panacagrimonas perspica]TDU32052.1 pimeloyl-ACP methyl ester carboxylesterase [Panacagrimonas perspica]THD04418.1 hypothetical protein B1810_05275 [Panacagrimonas perspica]
MGYAVVNGARLAWQQMGEGPDLILLHGVAASRAFWFPAAMALKARFRITLFDLRGHGYSERTASGYASQDIGRDLLGLMDALGIASADIVGHSYGGGAALEAAVLAPSRVGRLALLDTRVQQLQPQMRLQDLGELSPFEIAVLDRAGGPAPLEGETQIGFRFLEAAARQKVAGQEFSGSDDFVPFGEGGGASKTANAWIRLLDETRAREEFCLPGATEVQIGALRVPTLLMYGERSRCWPSARALSRLMPHARLVEIPRAGHFFPLSEPKLTLGYLGAFLESPLELPA